MIGTRLGPYRLDAHLGAGGMGTVYLADHGGKPVALKILHPHLLEKPGIFKRFQQEALAGRRVSHPNVVRTLDCDMVLVDRVPYCFLVMEYVEGRTIRETLDDLGRLSEELVREIARQIGAGLLAIHAERLIHRDMKPANVIISTDDIVKLMDFGVARIGGEGFALSISEQFLGTIRYAAPEQLRPDRSSLDRRADLFSLGVLLYEAASGHHPFPAPGLGEMVRQILEHEPPSIRSHRANLSPILDHVIHRLLRKNPADRFDSAGEFLALLDTDARLPDLAPLGRPAVPPAARRPAIRRETGLHGREEEIERLQRVFEEVSGGAGHAVLVEGGLGVGKTRLVDEFLRRLQAEGQEFDLLFGSYPPGGAAIGIGAFSRAVRDRLEFEGIEDGLARLVPGSTPLNNLFASVLRSEPPPGGTDSLTPDSTRTALTRIVQALAADRPVVVFIDDLHFAPDDGLSTFAAMTFGLPGHRILLIGTTRPELPQKWRADIVRLEHVTSLQIDRLSETAVGRLLVDALGSPNLAADIGPTVSERSDGNPLFIFEILRDLKENRLLVRREDGGWTSSGVSISAPVPLALSQLMDARLAHLGEDDRGVLELAACYGFEFDPTLVAEALELPRIRALNQLGRIEREHGVVRANGRRFVFDHHLVQETLRDRLSESLQEAYHFLIAETIERSGRAKVDRAAAADVCEHYLRGDRPERALGYLDGTLDYLEGIYGNERALVLIDRALEAEHLVHGADRVDLQYRGGGFLELTARHERARHMLEEAIEGAEGIDDATRGSRAQGRLGGLLSNLGDREEARKHIETAVELAVRSGDPDVEADARSKLGSVLSDLGRPNEARECYERSLALAAEARNLKAEAAAIANLAIGAWEEGRLAEAEGGLKRCLPAFRKLRDRRSEATVISILGHIFDDQGLFQEAAGQHRKHLRISREIGYRRGEAIATSNLGGALRSLGQLDTARLHYERSREISEEIGDRPGILAAIINLGVVERDLGRNASAIRLYRRALLLSREVEAQRDETVSLGGLALAFLDLGKPERARVLSEAAVEIAGKTLSAAGRGWALLGLGRSLVELGRPAEAAEQFEMVDRIGHETGMPQFRVLASCQLADLGEADPEAARSLLREFEDRLGPREKVRACHLLYRAGGRPEDLEASRAVLREIENPLTDDQREVLRNGVPLYREIVAESGG